MNIEEQLAQLRNEAEVKHQITETYKKMVAPNSPHAIRLKVRSRRRTKLAGASRRINRGKRQHKKLGR